jgi:hypothetical protein
VFEGLERVQGPDGKTVLTGPVIDQAALHRILCRWCRSGGYNRMKEMQKGTVHHENADR